ncbi:DUF4411 family protein [uncultured Halomonas sp.]|uniref:DUF4411 family protein n=1 Tax=uncultured Halomonas sp. TaxID=173971 RepID=UPI00261CE814|nr:DUF4411 family protein [uncultured Halomonas sp.]
MTYLLDANTYIQAKALHYRMHIVPGFWDWLDHQFGVGQVGSIRSVYDELSAGGDELSEWVRLRRHQFLAVDDEATQAVFADIADHVATHSSYQEPHVSSFLAGADPWLVAKAKAIGAQVVTNEARVGPGSKKVKVPNICDQFQVACLDTYDLLDTLRARFVLD